MQLVDTKRAIFKFWTCNSLHNARIEFYSYFQDARKACADATLSQVTVHTDFCTTLKSIWYEMY